MKFARFAVPLFLVLAVAVVPSNGAGAVDVGTVHGTITTWSDFHACATVTFSGSLSGTFTAVGTLENGGVPTPVLDVTTIPPNASSPWSHCTPAVFANPLVGDVTFVLEASTTGGATVVARTCEKTLATAFFCPPAL